jgi:chromosomal replication initiator protein
METVRLYKETPNYYILPGLKYEIRFRPARRESKLNRVTKVVCRFYGVATKDLIKSRRGCIEIATARQICMWIARRKYDVKLKTIGDHYDRDHSSVMHNLEVVKERMASDRVFRTQVENLYELA